MKISAVPSLMALLVTHSALALDLSRPSCLLNDNGLFKVTIDSCSNNSFRKAVKEMIAEKESISGASACLSYKNEMRLLAQSESFEPNDSILDICQQAMHGEGRKLAVTSFREVFAGASGFTDPQDDTEFFNGGTYLNTESDGTAGATPLSEATQFVDDIYSSVMSGPLPFPDNDNVEFIPPFVECNANAVTCCYVADRQSDGFGTCTGGDCSNKDPIDNTDVCYVDKSKFPLAGHTEGGFSIFPADSEGPVYCEGFAWSKPRLNEPSYRFRGNALFQVALKDNLSTRGYVREVPGAPMCGCVENMPVITDAACTELDVSEEFEFSMEVGGTPSVSYKLNSITPKACSEGSLSAHMASLAAGNKVSLGSKRRFDKAVTGGSCDGAVTEFLAGKGLVG